MYQNVTLLFISRAARENYTKTHVFLSIEIPTTLITKNHPPGQFEY